MTGRLLTSLARPFVVGVITEGRFEDLRAAIETARDEGADAVELNLAPLKDLSEERFRSLVGLRVPIYTTCRRRGFMAVYRFDPLGLLARNDDERMTVQLDLLRAGSVAIDIEMDTFDPSPAPSVGSDEAMRLGRTDGSPLDLSWDELAVARQRHVVERAHELGGEVLMSCHAGRRQTADQIVGIYEAAIARSADLVKIVAPCEEQGDLESLRDADSRLRKAAVPYMLLGVGQMGSLTRHPEGGFGSSWYVGRPSGRAFWFAGQPPVSKLRSRP